MYYCVFFNIVNIHDLDKLEKVLFITKFVTLMKEIS